VAAFTFVAALVTGVATGLVPAARATRQDVLPLLKEAGSTVGRTRHPLRSLLVVGQVAVACIVLVGAGLAVRSAHALANVNLGFRAQDVLLASFDLETLGLDRTRARTFQETLLREARNLPGVQSAGLARSAPFDIGGGLRGGIAAEGQPPPDRDEVYLVVFVPAEPGYLGTMGIPLLAGRALSERDTEKAPPVAIVNEAVARHFWPQQDPIGKRLTFGNGRPVEVVGLIGEIRYFMMADRDRPLIFVPLEQEFSASFTLAVRSARAGTLARPITDLARGLEPGTPMPRIRMLEEQIVSSPLALMPVRLGAAIAGVQGALVLLLAIMGIYGLVSFGVARRTREIGVRRALGAGARDVLLLVARPSLFITAAGLAVGLLLGAALALPLAAVLYGITPHDPLVFGGVALLLIGVSVAAAWLPARRAMIVSPLEALRAD
jgi:predicted permease